jgi:hypothetical protein
MRGPTATERANEAGFYRPADSVMPFKLDLSRKRQTKWDHVMADLPSVQGLRITSDIGHGLPRGEYAERSKNWNGERTYSSWHRELTPSA